MTPNSCPYEVFWTWRCSGLVKYARTVKQKNEEWSILIMAQTRLETPLIRLVNDPIIIKAKNIRVNSQLQTRKIHSSSKSKENKQSRYNQRLLGKRRQENVSQKNQTPFPVQRSIFFHRQKDIKTYQISSIIISRIRYIDFHDSPSPSLHLDIGGYLDTDSDFASEFLCLEVRCFASIDEDTNFTTSRERTLFLRQWKLRTRFPCPSCAWYILRHSQWRAIRTGQRW